MNIKSKILSFVLNRRQIDIIWNALCYSERAYRSRGNVNNAAIVQQVICELEPTFIGVPKTYTQQEVDAIVEELIDKAVDETSKTFFKQGYQAAIDSKSCVRHLKPFGTIDLSECERCKRKNNCLVREAILEVEEEERSKRQSKARKVEVEDGSEEEDEETETKEE